MKFEKIFVEITNFCGLDCAFCTPLKAQNTMPLSLFRKIAKEIAPFTKLCALHILGDPLSVESIKDYLDIAKDSKLKIEITTSGFYFNAENSMLLLAHPSVHQINISLMSALYQNKPVKLESYLKSIFELCLLHQQLKSEKFINLRLWNLNKDLRAPAKNAEMYERIKTFFSISRFTHPKTRLAYKIHLNEAPFFKWIKETGQESQIADLQGQTGQTAQELAKKAQDSLRQTAQGLAKNGLATSQVGQNQMAQNRAEGFCYGGSKQLGILCSGIVVPCCFDTQGYITLGDIRTQYLKEILQSPRLKSLTQGFKANKRVESLCQNCHYFLRH